MTKGPNTEESAVEFDEDPDREDLMESVEWAMTTDNVEMVNLVFEDDGSVSAHFQILSHRYNITKLNQDRFETVKSILGEYSDDIEFEEPGYTDVKVDVDIETHQNLVVRLIREVYDTSIEEIEEIVRSTYKKDLERETTVATCDECRDTYEVERLTDAFGADFYALTDDSNSVGEGGVDMVHRQKQDEWLCKICYDEAAQSS